MLELNIENHEQFLQYLQTHRYVAPDEPIDLITLSGGVSNRTVLVRRAGANYMVVKQALPKLRVKVDWFSDPARIHREALGLRWLARFAPANAVPAFIFEDETLHLLGMEAVADPHDNWKFLLLDGNLDQTHVQQFAQIIGLIHRCAYLERDVVAPVFADQSFFTSLRLEPYYLYTAEQLPPSKDFFYALVHETQANTHTLVHGDYSPKNILVRDGRLILLDHEVIHFGDPAFDLGFSLTHLLSKAHHVVAKRKEFIQAAQLYWRIYRNIVDDLPWAAELEQRVVWHTLGCLLARVDGRSPLEYLSETERATQRKAVLNLMGSCPTRVSDVIDAFVQRIS